MPEAGTLPIKIKITDISALCSEHCKIKNVEVVEQKLASLIDGGTAKLQVVSDFDYTITKQRSDDGEMVETSFGMFNECKSLPKSYLEASHQLYLKYRPMEIDPTIPIKDKIALMNEWWSLSRELLKGFPLPQTEIDESASRFKNCLRDGAHELLHSLNELNVPTLVFSAGLGDSVVSLLKHANVYYPTIKVVSNFLKYKDGLLDGFEGTMIHTYNKNETALEGTEYYDLIHDRDHVIVMGDSLGDSGMADGVPSSSHVLKIGFLFDHVEQNLPAYMNTFDIVLIDDQTMNVPRAILALITDTKRDRN